MTREDFMRGWLLLIAQPWGRRYADDTDIARVQSEFYLSRLHAVPADAWRKTCERLASKDSWPSLDDCMASLTEALPLGSRHPGVEQAWSMVAVCLRDEQRSIVWTQEMAEAFGSALALADDTVAARMAFKETYGVLLLRAKETGAAPKWSVSFGYSKEGRADAVREAVSKGYLTQDAAVRLLPHDISPAEAGLALTSVLGDTKRIGG